MQRFLALQRKKRLHNTKKVSMPKTRFVLVQGPAEQFQSWLGLKTLKSGLLNDEAKRNRFPYLKIMTTH